MKQTVATFLVKAPSFNPDLPIPSASPASSPSPLYQSAASEVFAIASATILVQGPPSAFSSSCSSNHNKGSRSSSSSGGSSKGCSSTSNTSIVAASGAAAAAAAWQPQLHLKRDPGQCMCNRYFRSPGSVPTSHAAITDLCPLPFRPWRQTYFQATDRPRSTPYGLCISDPPATCKISLQY